MITFRKLNEECGIAGLFGGSDAGRVLYMSLFALQHRGQEAAGIVTFDTNSSSEMTGPQISAHKGVGLVADVITETILQGLRGSGGVGHVRYSTAGGTGPENIQPFLFKTRLGYVAVAHNGNLTNASELRTELERTGSVFQSQSDSEVFVHLIARASSSSMRERISEALRQVRGAYSLLIYTPDAMYAVRDPHGLRPLVLGKCGQSFVVASETCAFDLIGAGVIRDIEPGEVVEISRQDIFSWFPQRRVPMSFCAFEPIYFARPDSLLFGESIYVRRRRIGSILAEECPASADVVIPIPDSGVAMAEGFSEMSSTPFAMGLVRNQYIGRTFIQPDQLARDSGVRLKLNAVKSVLAGKRVVVVDDSLVRGTTAQRILQLIRNAGAREIHLRIGSPPITHSCFYGVDTPRREQLMAAQMRVEQIKKALEVTSLGFISVPGLSKALEESPQKTYCMACFTGRYPEQTGMAVTPQPTDVTGTGLFC